MQLGKFGMHRVPSMEVLEDGTVLLRAAPQHSMLITHHPTCEVIRSRIMCTIGMAAACAFTIFCSYVLKLGFWSGGCSFSFVIRTAVSVHAQLSEHTSFVRMLVYWQ